MTAQSPTKPQDEAERLADAYAESCDNESGSFLSHQLKAIRNKAYLKGYRAGQASKGQHWKDLAKKLEGQVITQDLEITALREENADLKQAISLLRLRGASSNELIEDNERLKREAESQIDYQSEHRITNLKRQLHATEQRAQKLAGLLLEALGSLDESKNFSLIPDIKKALAVHNEGKHENT